MQLVITLKTEERDGADDDGVRTIYAKGGRYEIAKGEGSSMRDAIAEAVKEAKASSIEPGDELAVCFTGESKPTQRGFQPAKLYVAGFKKASKAVSASDLFGDGNERSGEPLLTALRGRATRGGIVPRYRIRWVCAPTPEGIRGGG